MAAAHQPVAAVVATVAAMAVVTAALPRAVTTLQASSQAVGHVHRKVKAVAATLADMLAATVAATTPLHANPRVSPIPCAPAST